jgi:hypothetical protein
MLRQYNTRDRLHCIYTCPQILILPLQQLKSKKWQYSRWYYTLLSKATMSWHLSNSCFPFWAKSLNFLAEDVLVINTYIPCTICLLVIAEIRYIFRREQRVLIYLLLTITKCKYSAALIESFGGIFLQGSAREPHHLTKMSQEQSQRMLPKRNLPRVLDVNDEL